MQANEFKEHLENNIIPYWNKIKDEEHDGLPDKSRPLVSPWKCPYHSGRMSI